MKNIFRFLMAVAVLFTASCAKEDISSSIGGGEVEVTFTANLPELGTRAYGEGKLVDILYYNVYEQGTDNKLDLSGSQKAQTQGQSLYTITLPMIKGMKYDIVFWAQVENCGHYTLDGKTVTVNYAGKANDESRDAFFGKVVEFDPVNPGDMTSVELRRPFAQLNAITNDCQAVLKSGISEMYKSSLKVTTPVCDTLDLLTGDASGTASVEYTLGDIPAETKTIIKDETTEMHLAMNYLLVNGEKSLVDVEFTFVGLRGTVEFPFTTVELGNIPVQRNYRTNIIGKLLTKSTDFEVEIKPGFDAAYDVEGETITAEVDTAEELIAALKDDSINAVVLDGDINLNDLLTRANNDPSLTIKSGKELTIDLNGKKLSSTSTQIGTNYNMFDVRGTLTVKNGTLETKHEGENMGWGNSTNLFNVTAGGVLNLEGVTAKNLGGSDMGFVAHLNNWGEVTLNAENCTLESNYVPVRVFNSGPDMNNVTIKNSTLKGVSAAFWVHNYTAVDFGSEAKAEAQKALLNLNIYGQGNTFSPDLNGIRYGFTNSIRTDAYGITKTVSEDGTEVTLGSIIENGLIRRGVAGAEENTTIKKAIVGEGVTTLYDRTFRRFYALETVELPSTLTTIGAAGSGVFQSCTALKNIVLPESVTVLGKGTFQECSSLESINIPAGVTRIEENTFNASGLESIEFHAGVTYFGAQAFRDCKQLKEVVINAPEFTMEPNAFGVMSGALPGTVIYVANAEMKAYLESTLAYKNQFTIVVHNSVSTADELKAALAQGGIVELNSDITLTEELEIPAGVTLNGNGKQINGSIYAGGDVTFAGHTKVTAFSAGYYNRTITIGEGACLEVTGTGRVSLAYGNTFDITGNVADAKTADKSTIQPSLIIPGGISITGGNDAVFNIKNAYVQIGSTSSKPGAANGTFTLNVNNSIAEFTKEFAFYDPTGSMNPTFNLNVVNSVLTTVAKMYLTANSVVTVDNSNLSSQYFANRGVVNVTNGSVLTSATIQFGENGGNSGTINVDASSMTITAGSTGSAFDGKGVGSINATNGATVAVDYYKDMTITKDSTSTFTGTEVQ